MVIPCKPLLTSAFVFGFVLSCFSTVVATSYTPSVGCADIFSTSITGGTNYQWEFGPDAYPKTLSGASLTTAGTAFLTPGNHTVIVFITTGGGTEADSVTINAQASAAAISLTSNIPVCEYDSVYQRNVITFTASTTPAYQSYAFFIDDSLYQLSAVDSFVTTLQFGDSVRVFGYNGIGTCFMPSNTLYEHTPPPPTLSSTLTNDTICSGALVVFTATPANYNDYYFSIGGSYQQKSSSNTYSTTTLQDSSTVSVRVIENGCFNYFAGNSTTVIVKPTPQMSLTVTDSIICQGTSVTFTATASQAITDSFIFLVNSVDVLDNSASTDTYTTDTLTNGDMVAVEGSLNGCYSRLSNAITMHVNTPPTVTLTSNVANDTICQGDTVIFTAVPSGYTAYNFMDGGISEQNTASNTYTTTALTAGNSITVTATNAGCPPSPSNSISTVVIPAPQVTLPTTGLSACASVASDTLTGFTPTGGDWTGTGITSDTLGVFSPSQAGAGNQTLTYTYTDPSTGCSSSPSLTFTVNPLPHITVTPSSATICTGQSVQLAASGASVYSWSPSTGLSDSTIANPEASPASTTTYTVTGTDNNQCSDTASDTVTVNMVSPIDFTYQAACSGQASTFTASTNPPAGTTVEWEFGDGGSSTSTDATHVYTSGSTFDVMLITTAGTCSDTSSQKVMIFQDAIASFYATPTIGYAGDSTPPIQFVNESANADIYSWNFGDQSSSTLASPTHVYANPGVYTVTLFATNQSGCSDSITRDDYILINPQPKIFIPNAFAPDGYNKVLHVYAEGLKFMDWRIFDRSGEKVYESNDINTEENVGWDGTYRGALAPEGVYVYTLKAVFEDNSQRFYKGSITLLR